MNPRVVFVFDTETTTDETQRLTFGAWHAYARPDFQDELEGPIAWRDYQRIDEGILHADNLAATDPEGYATLSSYVREHPRLKFHDRTTWLREVFYPLTFDMRALVVGFNMPFDTSRIASGVTRSTLLPGGFSFHFLDHTTNEGRTEPNQYRQSVAIRSLDSKRAFIELASARDEAQEDKDVLDSSTGRRRPYRGRFLDLRTLTFALTNESHSLASASEEFGVEHAKMEVEEHGHITPGYIDYCRRDVLTTWELYTKLREEFERHPIDLAPERAYSPAAVGKSYLEAMSIKPPLERQPDFPNEVLGYAMTAYFGGRAECRIRRWPVPVIYTDFLSMYPSVNTLMGNWDFLTAERIEIETATEEVRDFLKNVDLADMLKPETWHRLNV